MSEEKEVVEVMAKGIWEAMASKVSRGGGPSPQAVYYARHAITALEAEGYKITRSLTPGIIHPREEYKVK
jgi:hypothetical protein